MTFRLPSCLSIGLMLGLATSTSPGITLYVDAGCGDDLKAGTSPNCADGHGPKLTIQGGVDAAAQD